MHLVAAVLGESDSTVGELKGELGTPLSSLSAALETFMGKLETLMGKLGARRQAEDGDETTRERRAEMLRLQSEYLLKHGDTILCHSTLQVSENRHARAITPVCHLPGTQKVVAGKGGAQSPPRCHVRTLSIQLLIATLQTHTRMACATSSSLASATLRTPACRSRQGQEFAARAHQIA